MIESDFRDTGFGLQATSPGVAEVGNQIVFAWTEGDGANGMDYAAEILAQKLVGAIRQ